MHISKQAFLIILNLMEGSWLLSFTSALLAGKLKRDRYKKSREVKDENFKDKSTDILCP